MKTRVCLKYFVNGCSIIDWSPTLPSGKVLDFIHEKLFDGPPDR